MFAAYGWNPAETYQKRPCLTALYESVDYVLFTLDDIGQRENTFFDSIWLRLHSGISMQSMTRASR